MLVTSFIVPGQIVKSENICVNILYAWIFAIQINGFELCLQQAARFYVHYHHKQFVS